MADRDCTGCPGGCIYCVSRSFDRVTRERDEYRAAVRLARRVIQEPDADLQAVWAALYVSGEAPAMRQSQEPGEPS